MTRAPLVLVLLAVAGCAGAGSAVRSGGSATAPATASAAPATAITLPDAVCEFAGFGETMAFHGQRLSYTCGGTLSGRVILGVPSLRDDELTIERALVDRGMADLSLLSSTVVRVSVTRVELVDGTVCNFAGRGATLAVDGQRLNYTCGGPDRGILGTLDVTSALWTARLATIERGPDGPLLRSAVQVAVRSVTAG